jgi:hypothetical protein
MTSKEKAEEIVKCEGDCKNLENCWSTTESSCPCVPVCLEHALKESKTDARKLHYKYAEKWLEEHTDETPKTGL